MRAGMVDSNDGGQHGTALCGDPTGHSVRGGDAHEKGRYFEATHTSLPPIEANVESCESKAQSEAPRTRDIQRLKPVVSPI